MFGLFRKPQPPPPEPRKVEIKREHQMELRQLWDAYRDCKKNPQAVRYAFWNKAHNLYPELDGAYWGVSWGGIDGTFTEVLD